MSSSKLSSSSAGQSKPAVTAYLLLGFGLLGLLASFVIPKGELARRQWSTEQAVEHQSRSTEVHQLTLGNPQDRESRRKLADAERAFADLEADRQDALRNARTFKKTLRWGGLALSILGALLHSKQNATL